jgi:hypothetical protein
MTHITAKGMFSRHRTSPPQEIEYAIEMKTSDPGLIRLLEKNNFSRSPQLAIRTLGSGCEAALIFLFAPCDDDDRVISKRSLQL